MTDESIDPEKLKVLQAAVGKLPRAVQPPDVFANIRSQIELESVTSNFTAKQNPGVRYWQRPLFLMAAAAALIAMTSTTTMIALREKPSSSGAVTARTPMPPEVVQFASRENNYIETATRLQTLIESEQSTLSPETIAKLKRSVAIIDAAIAEARAALAADPANRDLMDMLSSSYDKKLDLLRRSAAMGRS